MRRGLVSSKAEARSSASGSAPAFPSPAPKTRLVLEEALVGRTICEGLFVNRFTGGETTFSVAIDGTWDGAVLTLVEDFAFGDGSKERKTWRMAKIGDGVYRGTREDVIGAADVRQDGNGVRLDYHVTLATAMGPLAVRFQDLLTLDVEGVIVNRAVVTKFGVRVGRVELLMRRVGAQSRI